MRSAPAAGKQDAVARFGREGLEMMQHAAAGGHAAGGDQDHRSLALRQRLGFRRFAYVMRDGKNLVRPFRAQGVGLRVLRVKFRHVGSHGAVDENGSGGKLAGLLQFP